MAEFLPEQWAVKPEDSPKHLVACLKSQVTNLVMWTQCFAIYMAAMASKHSEAVPELMAYSVPDFYRTGKVGTVREWHG